jgi:hypothetical protein
VPFYLKPLFYIPASVLAGYLVYHIDTVELTGRQRLLLLPMGVFAWLMEVVDEGMLENVSNVILPETSPEHRLIQVYRQIQRFGAGCLRRLRSRQRRQRHRESPFFTAPSSSFSRRLPVRGESAVHGQQTARPLEKDLRH